MFKPIKYFLNLCFPTKTKREILKLRETETEKIFLLVENGRRTKWLCHSVDGFEGMWRYLLASLNETFLTMEHLGHQYSRGSFKQVESSSMAIREEIKKMSQEEGRVFSLKDFLDVFIKHMDKA